MNMSTRRIIYNLWHFRAVTCSTTSRLIYTSHVALFWERDPKGGYLRDEPKPRATELIRDGLKELKSEIMLWKEEMKERLDSDPIVAYRRGK
jgi:NADH dehydrogenase [ubiquinone] 1 alpha subcomplex assembly factor 1